MMTRTTTSRDQTPSVSPIQHLSATFFVRAKGDSIKGEGIFDGDLLIVDHSLEPKDGDVLIMRLDNELACKKLGKIRLTPLLRSRQF